MNAPPKFVESLQNIARKHIADGQDPDSPFTYTFREVIETWPVDPIEPHKEVK